jgi:hypothetical protein
VALDVEIATLIVKIMALNAENVALKFEIVVLTVEIVALTVEIVTLTVENVALNAEIVTLIVEIVALIVNQFLHGRQLLYMNSRHFGNYEEQLKTNLCLWLRASLIYTNNCATRCNIKISIYYLAFSLHSLHVCTVHHWHLNTVLSNRCTNI